jgi:hypothetical protein
LRVRLFLLRLRMALAILHQMWYISGKTYINMPYVIDVMTYVLTGSSPKTTQPDLFSFPAKALRH